MKINIKQDNSVSETEITIICKQIDSELETIISNLSLIDNTVAGKTEGETYFVSLLDVLYFETIDNKTFFYSKDKILEIPLKIFQLEEKLSNTNFVRISKSIILNLKKVKSIKSEPNSRLVATLSNGEKVLVSRQYMQYIKNKLGV
ncbi:MAG: histidine kinase [Clostridia bacterium]|jgi:DNA-binding LytR/AlgR family response regulator|nr:histidine kinase [Clostridia bacterium]